MKTRIVRNCAIAGVLLTSFGVQAQTTTNTTTNTTTKVEQKADVSATANDDHYSTSAIDLTTQKLPPNYAGNDPELIYSQFDKKFGAKGEFETTLQYQERLKNERTKPLFGNFTINNIFTSNVDHSHDNETGKAYIHYDADKEVMNIASYLIKVPDPYPATTKKQSIGIETIQKPLGTYVGQNSYGAKVNILRENEYRYCLLLNNLQDFDLKISTFWDKATPFLFKIPMKAGVAQKAKDNIQTLLIYHVVEPFTREQTSHISPTMQNLREGDLNYYYLNAEINEIWFYNAITGEIYYKLRPSKHQESQATTSSSTEN